MGDEHDNWLVTLGVSQNSFGILADTGGDDQASKTDSSGLVTTSPISISPDGGSTDEPFPKQGVEYDFCVNVANGGKLPSGPFFVRFTLSGDQDPPLTLDSDPNGGLDSGDKTQAVVHFGKFPNKFATYHLTACIFAKADPSKAINCAGDYDFTINSE
jgi:hypothetical protein